MDFLQPPGWPRARGYSNGIAASGRTVFVSGMIGWDAQCTFQTDDFAQQVRQALLNVVAVLAEAGALERGLKVRSLALPDRFIDHEAPAVQLGEAGLDVQGILRGVFGALGRSDDAGVALLRG